MKTPALQPGFTVLWGQMKIYTVTLNSAVDVVVSEQDYKESGYLKAERIPAGKGINVSRALKSAGIPSVAVAFVGEEDKWLFDTLKGELIDTQFFTVPGKTRINATICCCEDNLEHHERTMGYTAGEKEYKQIYDYLLDNIYEGDWVIFSGSLPTGMDRNAYAGLIRLCKMKGAYTALDTSGAGLLCGLAGEPYVIKPNKEELEEIIGEDFEINEQEFANMRELSNRFGIQIILATVGEEGAVLYSREEDAVYRHPAVKDSTNIVSSVGCGDSALAGLVSGLLNSLSYEECLKEAVVFASANLYTKVPGELKKWEE